MARKIKIGRGRAAVDMDSAMHDTVNRVLSGSTYGQLVRRMEDEAEALLADARSQWPIGKERTGKDRKVRRGRHSRDALQAVTRLLPPDRIEAVVQIDPRSPAVEYAYYIKSPKVGKQGKGIARSPYQTLLRRPGEKRGKKLAVELHALLARIARGGV